jgi:hypothetical protein
MASQPVGQVISPDEDEEILAGESSLSIHEEADRSHQVATAKRFPRSITTFRNELKAIAIASQPVAMEMMYSLPRAGKQLVGPSIRFAEALVSCWGNARVGVEVVDVNTQEAVVVAEGRFYDCEKNVGFAIRTRRRNVTSKKDADSYQVTGSAASSIALRNAILRGVPKALWNDIFEMAKQTAAGDAASMEVIRTEMIKLFTAIGITEARLFTALGIPGIADIGPDEIVAMKAWRKQLQAKEMTIEDIFGDPADEEIEWLMRALGWNETQKRMSKTNFAKDKTGQLTYLRTEAAKANIVYSSAKGAGTPPAAKEGDTSTQADARPSERTTQASQPSGQQQSESKPTTSETKTGTTAAASTSAAAATGKKAKVDW